MCSDSSSLWTGIIYLDENTFIYSISYKIIRFFYSHIKQKYIILGKVEVLEWRGGGGEISGTMYTQSATVRDQNQIRCARRNKKQIWIARRGEITSGEGYSTYNNRKRKKCSQNVTRRFHLYI